MSGSYRGVQARPVPSMVAAIVSVLITILIMAPPLWAQACSSTPPTAGKTGIGNLHDSACPSSPLPQITTLAGDSNGTLHVFVRGTDGALYPNSRSGGSFSGWSAVPGGGKSSSQPAAILDGSGFLRLYIQGVDNGLWVNTRSGGTWSGWSAVPGGGKSSSGPAVVLDGSSVRLVVRGLDDGIWTALADNPQWTALGGRTNHSPAAVLEGSTLHLFVRGTDGALYLNSRSGGSFGGWSAVPGGGQSSSQPAALLDGSSAVRLYVQGADNGLWVNTKSGSTWSGWSAVSGGGKSSSGPAVVLDGSAVRLVVRGLDDGIWTALADNPQWTALGGKTSDSPAIVTEGGQGSVQLSSLSPMSASPAQLLTLTGSGFDPTARISVRFTDAQNRTVEVPAVQVTATTITVPVPPFVDPVSGLIDAGVVNVRVVEVTSSSTMTSNVVSGFQIQSVSVPAGRAGAVTLAFLSAARTQALALQGEALATSVSAALGTQMDNLGPLILNIQTVIDNPSATFTIGSISGTSLTIGAAQLRATDQMLLAMFQALAQPGAGGAASLDSPPRPAQSSTSGCLQSESATAALAPDDASIRNMVAASRGSVLCATPHAFNTAYLLVAGVGAVGIGIMGLAGASAMALALPTAALLYVTVTLGAGEIGLGGALNQTTAAAGQLVQQGVETVEGGLRILFTQLVLPHTAGDIVHIAEGAHHLSELSTQSLLPPPAPPPPPPSPTVQCCVGTNGCPGETGSRCGQACCCCGVGERCCPNLTQGCCAAGAGTWLLDVIRLALSKLPFISAYVPAPARCPPRQPEHQHVSSAVGERLRSAPTTPLLDLPTPGHT